MDEVDKIIIHSLRQIGCKLNANGIFTMSDFVGNSELLVDTVSICIQHIKPEVNIQRLLSDGGMVQHHSVASHLAELCTSCGYQNDIGYQTFLYPTVADARRLFMFLIEQMPRNSYTILDNEQMQIDDCDLILNETKEIIAKNLKSIWIPHYCQVIGHRRHNDRCTKIFMFNPQLNLSILCINCQKEELNYLCQTPNVFQQIRGKDYDLISSVLHKNSVDLYNDLHTNGKTIFSLKLDKNERTKCNLKFETILPKKFFLENSPKNTEIIAIEKLNQSINEIKTQNDLLLNERKGAFLKSNELKVQKNNQHEKTQKFRKQIKFHDCTSVVLENSKENVTKLNGLIITALERRNTLEQQWQFYQQPLLEKLKTLQTTKNTHCIQNVMDLNAIAKQLEQTLHEKTAHYSQLTTNLSTITINAVQRREYTKRIFEFVSNIRKQRNDVFKVLDDTRDLQKQINSISAQLQRQFNYTDDLLFQSAKHDLHAKKAYKLLATLHETCNSLINLVSQTGTFCKEIRDLEEQIDREQSKNISKNLERIMTDTKSFQNVIKNIQIEIHEVENQITAG